MKTSLYLIHALSPLHAGTGQSVGAIDLPIARERATGIPLVPGSSVKGALRARYDRDDKHTIFGPDTEHAAEFAGAVQFSDAHLLLLPVRSIAGTFAWVTSPYLLQRFARDAKEGAKPMATIPSCDDQKKCLVTTAAKITTDVKVPRKNNGKKPGAPEFDTESRVVLEDLDLASSRAEDTTSLANNLAAMLFSSENDSWRQTFIERFCIVHDDVMSLLLETATEVTARIRLNEQSKTVDKGALWYEEALPTESILYGLVAASNVSERVVNEKLRRKTMEATDLLTRIQTFAETMGVLQVGGKSTVGRGTCLLHLVGGGAS